jgi:hypothetical protein
MRQVVLTYRLTGSSFIDVLLHSSTSWSPVLYARERALRAPVPKAWTKACIVL